MSFFMPRGGAHGADDFGTARLDVGGASNGSERNNAALEHGSDCGVGKHFVLVGL
jgi:hypothetical protein